jgi:general secretion pathway protein M
MKLWRNLFDRLKTPLRLKPAPGSTEGLAQMLAPSALRRMWRDPATMAALYQRFFKQDLKLDRTTGAALLFAAFIVISLIFIGLLNQAADVAIEERDAKLALLTSLQETRVRQGEPNAVATDSTDEGEPFIAAASETQAAAEIDRLLRKIVAESDGSVLSTHAEPKHDEEQGAMRKIEASLVMEGKIETIQKALYAIESGSPFIFVDLLALAPVNEASDRNAAGGSNIASPLLRATLTTSAYWKLPS